MTKSKSRESQLNEELKTLELGIMRATGLLKVAPTTVSKRVNDILQRATEKLERDHSRYYFLAKRAGVSQRKIDILTKEVYSIIDLAEERKLGYGTTGTKCLSMDHVDIYDIFGMWTGVPVQE